MIYPLNICIETRFFPNGCPRYYIYYGIWYFFVKTEGNKCCFRRKNIKIAGVSGGNVTPPVPQEEESHLEYYQ